MPAPKGHAHYYKKSKGYQNKVTTQTKKLITAFMNENFDNIVSAWESLEPLDRLKTYISLVKYVMPILTSVKIEDSNGEDVLKRILDNQK